MYVAYRRAKTMIALKQYVRPLKKVNILEYEVSRERKRRRKGRAVNQGHARLATFGKAKWGRLDYKNTRDITKRQSLSTHSQMNVH